MLTCMSADMHPRMHGSRHGSKRRVASKSVCCHALQPTRIAENMSADMHTKCMSVGPSTCIQDYAAHSVIAWVMALNTTPMSRHESASSCHGDDVTSQVTKSGRCLSQMRGSMFSAVLRNCVQHPRISQNPCSPLPIMLLILRLTTSL